MPCRCILYVQKIEVVFPSFLLMSHNGRISFCSSMQYTLIEILFWFSNFLIWFSIIEIMSVRFNRCIMRIRRGYVQSVLPLTRYRAATYRVKHTTLSMDHIDHRSLHFNFSREFDATSRVQRIVLVYIYRIRDSVHPLSHSWNFSSDVRIGSITRDAYHFCNRKSS